MALRLDEDAPAGAETAEGVVEPAGDGDQLGGDGGIEIGTAKARRALELPSLLRRRPEADQRAQGRSRRGGWRCGDIRRGSSWSRPQTDRWTRGCADAGADLDEERIAFRRPDGREMADGPDQETDQPEAQAEARRRRPACRSGWRWARSAAEQDVLGQRPWTGTVKPGTSSSVFEAAAIRRAPRRRRRRTTGRSSTPPKAIESRRRSGSAGGSRRLVSPKASVRPVAMMMMTATILATGPFDGLEDCSGASHGMEEPEA